MTKLSTLLVAGGLALAAPLQAQTGNASDVTGPNTTGSTTVAGGAYAPSPQGGGNGGGGNAAAATAAASPTTTAAVGAASTATASALGSGSMTGANGAPISAGAQAAVLSVMTGGGSPGAAAQVEASLAAGGAPAAAVAEVMGAIGELLTGTVTASNPILLASATGALDPALAPEVQRALGAPAADPVVASRAMDAFNDLVMQTSAAYLASPPDEFLAIHATLKALSEAYSRAAADM